MARQAKDHERGFGEAEDFPSSQMLGYQYAKLATSELTHSDGQLKLPLQTERRQDVETKRCVKSASKERG